VLPEHWGNGYAFEAASGLRDWFFRANDDDRFIGLADVDNTPSLAILTRIGMTPTHVAPYGGPGGRPYQFHVYSRDDLGVG
jgi:RimJ/RimL family protein N-acetyltransferase